MLQETTGRFFHIDFGHFLDSCKFKCRIKRDREPFIYSDELNYFLKKFEAIKANQSKEHSGVKSQVSAKAIDSEQKEQGKVNFNLVWNEKQVTDAMEQAKEQEFEKKAEEAFLQVRQNAHIFINLLVLMLVSGMQELSMDSISFVKKALFLDISDEEASLKFKNVI
jgi:phosphatidylinositol-4,5-bisphosphate 3-kinase